MCSVVLVSGAHFVPVKRKQDTPLQFRGPKAADCRWNSSREEDSRENRYQQCCHQHLKEGVAINDLTLLPQASLRFDAQTHTRGKWDEATSHQHSLIMLWSFTQMPQLCCGAGKQRCLRGHTASLKWAKEEGRHPWWHRRKTASPLSWGRSIQNLVFLFCFLLPLEAKEKEAKMASAVFSDVAFFGNWVVLELNQSKMAAGRFICDDPHDVPSYLFCVAKNVISADHNGHLFKPLQHQLNTLSWFHSHFKVFILVWTRRTDGSIHLLIATLSEDGAGASPRIHWMESGSFSKIKTIRGPSAASDISVLLDVEQHRHPPKAQAWPLGGKASVAGLFSRAPGRWVRRDSLAGCLFSFSEIHDKMMEVWPRVAEWSHTDTDTLRLLDEADILSTNCFH